MAAEAGTATQIHAQEFTYKKCQTQDIYNALSVSQKSRLLMHPQQNYHTFDCSFPGCKVAIVREPLILQYKQDFFIQTSSTLKLQRQKDLYLKVIMLFLSFKRKESGCHINLCSQIRILAIPNKGNFPLGSPKKQKKAQISDFCHQACKGKRM